jgi:hypothetical protein
MMLAYFISGYGMTKEIINPAFAKYLHEVLLPIPMFVLFIIHVAVNAKLAFIRWGWAGQKWTNFYIIISSLFFLAFFLWLYLV